ncbi:hypothetical protein COU57_02980 [Candidatus Pacearchaeota archaeon CG10_big_fil_rev_8_21_14_0_10_32_14]|nr:MAG: hypothetical protein COU57_02980 [Candidatus Pacearchaeota archaeon CG10_big_fil_rev_8_21_14_0_10_32_14]
MERQIKKTIKAGNSSAVLLPRSWLNKDVRVELIKKSKDVILNDILILLKKEIELKNVIGIYLVGSYAREEEDEKSDIDILVITRDIDKEMIHEGIYNILIMSKDLLEQKLEKDIFPVGQMIKEAIPLLNSYHLDSLDVKITKKNVKWYLDTTQDKLRLIKKIIDRGDKNKMISDRISYTLILRIRTLYIIHKLINNEDYSKKEFIKLIKKVSGGINSYRSYLRIKNNFEDEVGVTRLEVEKLCNYLTSELSLIKKQVL